MYSYRYEKVLFHNFTNLGRDAKFICQALSTASGGETLTTHISVFKYDDLDHFNNMGSFSTHEKIKQYI